MELDFELPSRPDTPLSDTEILQLASSDILRIRARSFVCSLSFEALWRFSNISAPHPSVPRSCLQFLSQMKSSWRTHSPTLLAIPDAWMNKIEAPHPDSPNDIKKDMLRSLATVYVSPVKGKVALLSDEEITDRHSRLDYYGPDFALTRHQCNKPSGSKYICSNLDESFQKMTDMMMHSGDSDALVQRMANVFADIPGCWLQSEPSVLFYPNCQPGNEDPIAYACSLQQVAPTRRTTARKAHVRPLSLLNPGLLLGFYEDVDDVGEPLSEETSHLIAKAVQPHLEAMIIALTLRREQGLFSPQIPCGDDYSLPEWAIIFGLHQRGNVIYIVAHVPYFQHTSGRDEGQYQFHSVLLDVLPFHRRIHGLESLLDRYRVVIALFALRKQANRLSAVWADIVWPQNIVDLEQIQGDEETGISSPGPSDETYDEEAVRWPSELAPDVFIASGGSALVNAEEVRHSKVLVSDWLGSLGSDVAE